MRTLLLVGLVIIGIGRADSQMPVPRDTPVELMVMREVSARSDRPGTRFRLETTQPIRDGARVAIPQGATAWGEVVEAEPAGAGGRGGRIAVRLLFVESADGPIRLDGASSAAARRSSRDIGALGASVGVFALLAKGHEGRIKAGETMTGFVADGPVPSGEAGRTAILRAETPVTLELLEGLSSETAVAGMRVALAVTEDVRVDGAVLVPKGAKAYAQVVRVDRKAAFGTAGTLAIELLYVDTGATFVRLAGGAGQGGRNSPVRGLSRSAFAGAAAVAITGRRAEIPAGALVSGRVLRDVALPVR